MTSISLYFFFKSLLLLLLLLLLLPLLLLFSETPSYLVSYLLTPFNFVLLLFVFVLSRYQQVLGCFFFVFFLFCFFLLCLDSVVVVLF